MLFILLLVSFIVRLVALNQSVWLDEAISANVSKYYSLIEIPTVFSPSDFHPPFYYMFLHIWENLFGNGVIALRLPSVFFSLVTIYFVYQIGRFIKDKKTGLWAGFILSLNPLFVYYSQEIRMYSMVVMFLTICLYNFIKIVKSKKPETKNIVGMNIFGFLSFMTFYGSIFLLAAMALYFLFKRQFELFLISNAGVVLAILILSPLLWTQFKNSKIALATVVNWSSVLGKANLKNLLLIPLKFSVGRISFYPKIAYYAISGLWSFAVLVLAVKGAVKNKIWAFLICLPIFMAFVFSLFSPLLDYFRFLYLIPILAIAITLSLKINWQRVLVALIFGIFTSIYLLNPKFYREDWKGMASNLDNTKALYIIESVADPIKYYRPDVIIKDLKTRQPTENEIVVVPYAESIHGFDHKVRLESFGYKKKTETSFREVTIEIWNK